MSITYLKWKRLEPFSEEVNDEVRFGFRLYGHEKMEDFYVSTQDELDDWLNKLQQRAILTDILEDFQLIEAIGTGNYAKVFRAKCLENNQIFAIKSIQKQPVMADLKTLLALLNEIDVMRSLHHDSIIRLHRVYEDEHQVHLVMDYAAGKELYSRVVKRKRYSEEQAAILIFNLLDAINYLHSNDIVHRDLKLENILLVSEDEDTRIQVADFGLACFTSDSAGLKQRCGSPGYVAPEIFDGMSYDSKVDIFSIGIIMYIILSGRTPFPGATAQQIIEQNRK